MVMAHLREAPPSLVKHAANVPQALADIIMAGLAKDANDRPAAMEMARLLLASGLPQQWDDERRQTWWTNNDPAPSAASQLEHTVPVVAVESRIE
jgi:hypothetical protein